MRLFRFLNDKGYRGESAVVRTLRRLRRRGYRGRILRNVYVPRKDGGTSEIDVVFITAWGVFVIESKRYSGYIFGDASQRYWTETLYAGKSSFGNRVEKYKFYNPIWQNRSHVNCLADYLQMPIPFFSFIVFSGDFRFKRIRYESDCNICAISRLNLEIINTVSAMPKVLSSEDIDNIYLKLRQLSSSSKSDERAHVAAMQERLVRESFAERCPRCGGDLVLRTAKKPPYTGQQFYGCSNYPRCRYIKPLD